MDLSLNDSYLGWWMMHFLQFVCCKVRFVLGWVLILTEQAHWIWAVLGIMDFVISRFIGIRGST